MDVKNVSLAAVTGNASQYPTDEKFEIAFVGKSNVGKSTLINNLINRRALARTSSQPGKTRTINFYNVEDVVYFVDLPGYGYAKISKTEKEKWTEMIESYLKKREQLKYIFLLIDIRHEPGSNDKLMYEWLTHYGFEVVIIATKKDKINRSQVNKQISVIRKRLDMPKEQMLIAFSSETKQGKEEIWDIIDKSIVG